MKTETLNILFVLNGARYLSTQIQVPSRARGYKAVKEGWLQACHFVTERAKVKSDGITDRTPVYIAYGDEETFGYTVGEMRHEVGR